MARDEAHSFLASPTNYGDSTYPYLLLGDVYRSSKTPIDEY
jgi:hypothetical protein